MRKPVLLLLLAVAGAAAAQEVTMPLESFDALRERAYPIPTPTPTPVPPPAPLALEAAAVEVTLGATSARITERLTVTMYAPDWQLLTLPPAGTLLANDLGGLDGRVAADTSWALHLKGSGRHVLRLESVVPVTTDEKSTRPTRTFELALPEAAAVTGVVTAGPEVEELEIQVGAVSTGRRPDGSWGFVGAPGSTCRIVAYGKAQAPRRSALKLRSMATAASLASVSRTRVRVRSWVGVKVLQGQLETMSLEVPTGFTVVGVSGTPAVGWDAKDRRLTVTPEAPVEGKLDLVVSLTGPPTPRLASPLVVPKGAARTTLLAAVVAEGDGAVAVEGLSAFRGPDERELASVAADFRQQVRFSLVVPDPAAPPTWVVSWPDKTEQLAAQVDRLLVDVLAGEAGQAAYQCWAVVRNAGATSLGITLPPGFELTGAGRDGAVVLPGVREGALVVPLAAGDAAQIVHVAGLLPLALPAEGTFRLPLPALSAPVARVEVRLGLPGQRTYEVDNQTYAGIIPPKPQAAAASRKGLAQELEIGAASRDRWVPALFALPAGFVQVQSAWSALTAAPAPLELTSEAQKASWEWF